MSSNFLYCDIETFSEADLKKVGVYAYAADPSFEILFCWWTTDGVEYHLAVGAEEISEIPGLWDVGVTKVAHNAPFERVCFSEMSGYLGVASSLSRSTAGYLDPDTETWLDTAGWAASLGLPRSLDKLAAALGVEPKDSAGTRLINTFCKLVRGKRIRPEDKPLEWIDFLEYGRQDVVTLFQVHQGLIAEGEWTASERGIYYVDQVINDRGVAVDLETAKAAVAAGAENQEAASEELCGLLNIANANSVQQLTAGLEYAGLEVPDLRAETVETLLRRTDLATDQRRALELRQELALSAAKKFQVMVDATVDGRLRGSFRYHGAHTGRWAGALWQPHNLPRHMAEHPEAVITDLMLGLGASPMDLKGTIRSVILLDGVAVDYSSIEARIIGWYAGETWLLDAFRAGKDIYVEQAALMGPQYGRTDGKVATLALGFQGAVGALQVMGATGSEEELLRQVKAYRKSNPNIVQFWYDLDDAFKRGGEAGRIHVERFGDRRQHRQVFLPSGRALTYRSVAVNSEGEISFTDHRGVRTYTYGGRLAENATQAGARDILAGALVRLHNAGYEIVGHVHDEAWVQNTDDVETISKIMCDLPEWADGLPLAAEGATMRRYRK
jgi:DNA polymerase